MANALSPEQRIARKAWRALFWKTLVLTGDPSVAAAGASAVHPLGKPTYKQPTRFHIRPRILTVIARNDGLWKAALATTGAGVPILLTGGTVAWTPITEIDRRNLLNYVPRHT